MTDDRQITLFYAPNTRASGTRVLLEELGAPYTLHVLNFKTGDHLDASYRALNPLGKVPAIRHGESIVTEQGAITCYLGDLFPEAGLAPALGSALRGPYLRWLFLYGSAVEPAVIDHYLKREPAPRAMSPYGSYDDVIATIVDQLRAGPWLFGEQFTAADVLWGMALSWLTAFKLIPEEPPIRDYVQRFGSRPTVVKVRAEDAELAAAQKAA